MPAFSAIGAYVAGTLLGLTGTAAVVAGVGLSWAGIAVASVVAIGASYITSRIINGNQNKGGNGAGNQGGRIQLPPASNNKIPVVYGSAFINGIITDARITDDNKTMYYCMLLSEKTQSGTYTIEDIYSNDLRLVFEGSGSRHKVNKGVKRVDGPGEDFENSFVVDSTNLIEVRVYAGGTGSANQIFPTTDTPVAAYTYWDNGSGSWTSSYEMKGLVFAIVKVRYNTDKGLTSVPNFTFKLKNTLDNPAAVWRDYMTSRRYGAGVSTAMIPTGAGTAYEDWYNYSNDNVTYTDKDGTPSQTQRRYTINGVIDTSRSVKTNIDSLLQSGGAWLSYDVSTGQWEPIVKRAATAGELSAALAFNDNNIISGITINSTNLDDLYNAYEVEFFDKYNKDQRAYARDQLSSGLNPNEPENTLRLGLEFVNNSVQADIIGNIELRQTRDDLVVEFTASHYGVQAQAGDVIKITNDIYGWAPKLFRVVRVKEIETEEGALVANIQALEYNADVYTVEDLSEFTTEANIGIIPLISTGTATANIQTPEDDRVSVVQVNDTAAVPNIVIIAKIPTSGGPYDEIQIWYAVGPTASSPADNAYTLLQTHRAPPPAVAFNLGRTITATAITSNVITSTAHGLQNGDQLYYYSANANGFVQNTLYYVIDAASNTFKVSLTEGGTAVSLTNGSGLTLTLDTCHAITISGLPANATGQKYYFRTRVGVRQYYSEFTNPDSATVATPTTPYSPGGTSAGFNLSGATEGETIYYDATTSAWRNTSILTIDDDVSGVQVNNQAGMRIRRIDPAVSTGSNPTVLTLSAGIPGSTSPTPTFGPALAFEYETTTADQYDIGAYITCNQSDLTDNSGNSTLIFQVNVDNSYPTFMSLSGDLVRAHRELYINRDDGLGYADGFPSLAVDQGYSYLSLAGDPATTTLNTVGYPIWLEHKAINNSGTGIGTGIKFNAETAANNIETGMTIEAVTTDITNNSEDFDFVVKLMRNGSAASEQFRVASTGDTTIQGDLQVKGDDIKSNTGATAITLSGANVTIAGNLTVNGTTTTVNSTTTTLDDPIITLGGDTAPISDDNKDRGVEFRYYDTQARLGFFGYDDSTSKFVFLTAATNTSEVFSGTKGEIDASVDWSNILNKPDPVITLAGDLSGSVTLTDLASGTLTATIVANAVALGTDTTGNYVATVAAGTGISVSGSGVETAAVTVTNTDLGSSQNIFKNVAVSGQSTVVADTNNDTLTFAGSTGLTITTDATTDTVTFTNSGVTSIAGTTNQITASASTGSVTLSTPQDIHTGANPTFAGLTVSGDIAVNGGDITTLQTTFNLIDTNATTVNAFGATTTLNLGYDSTTGNSTTNINTAANTSGTKTINIGTGNNGGGAIITLGGSPATPGSTSITLGGSTVINRYTGGQVSTNLQLSRNEYGSAVPSDGDTIRIYFSGVDDTGFLLNYGNLDFVATDVSNGTTDSDFVVYATANSSTTEKFRVVSTGDAIVQGDLQVKGNDIVSSSGATALTLSGSNVSTTGQLTANTVNVNSQSLIESPGSISTNSTSEVVLDSFAKATYTTAKYIIQATQTNIVHSSEALIIHNGTTAYVSVYADTNTGTALYSNVTADISGSNVRLLVTPSSSTATTFKVFKIQMT